MAKYLFGTQYIFYTNFEGRMLSDEEIERDLENMVKFNIGILRLTLMWADIAVAPSRLELSRADYIMDVAYEKGLKVQIGFLHDSAPSWAVAKYSDARYVSAKGEEVYFTLGRAIKGHPGLCLDHPGVKGELEKFYGSVVEKYRNHPAIHSWEPWVEIWFNPNDNTIYESERESFFCYCKYTVDKFRKWLASKYSSISKLNEAWLSSFNDWSEVEPPRFKGQRVVDWLDWKTFLIENQISHLKWLTNIIRVRDPDHPIYVHVPLSCVGSKWSKMESKVEGFYLRDYRSMVSSVLIDDWKAAPIVDVYGLSLYPTNMYDYYLIIHGRELSKEEKLVNADLDIALNLDAIRCACEQTERNYIIAELPGQFGGLFEPYYDRNFYKTQRIWTFMGLARDSKGVIIWEWRHSVLGTYAPSYGLCDENGNPTERTEVVARLAEELDKVYSYVKSMERISSDIGIVFSPRSYIYDWAHFGDLGRSRYSILGYYKALWELNYPVDIVHIDYLSKVKNYKLLIFPWPIIFSESELEKIHSYLKRGGKAVIEARFASKNKCGVLRRKLPVKLSRLLGFTFGEILREDEIVVKPNSLGESAPSTSLTLPIAVCSQSIKLERIGEIVGVFKRSGNPAIVLSNNVLAIGTFMGLSYVAKGGKSLLKMVDYIAKWAGVSRTAEVYGVPEKTVVEVNGFKKREEYLFIVINHSTKTIEPLIKFNIPSRKYVVNNIIEGSRLIAENNYIRLKLEPRDVAVLYFEPK
ncbi:MAG: hypothetical protein DRJ52_03435 [Thermoprotei archaeon]|nr:MAG: hypothetical protein DRJ52_03435 [Thermoprotei archaeon]